MIGNRDPLPGPVTVNTTPIVEGNSDLAAIRALLLAIARHNSIEVPKEASALGTLRNTALDPGGSQYDEDKTISYRVRQLPRGLALETETAEGEPLELKTEALRIEDFGPGISSVLLWSFDTHTTHCGQYVEYEEFGYDESGSVFNLECRDAAKDVVPRTGGGSVSPRTGIREHIVCGSKGRVVSSSLLLTNAGCKLRTEAGQHPNPGWKWERQFFGKEW